MFGFLAHVAFVLLCLGLGYMIRFSMEEFKALDQQIELMQHPEPRGQTGNYQPQTAVRAPGVPEAMSVVKLGADPAKLTELKASLKK